MGEHHLRSKGALPRHIEELRSHWSIPVGVEQEIWLVMNLLEKGPDHRVKDELPRTHRYRLEYYTKGLKVNNLGR